jgi:hypothetical protein
MANELNVDTHVKRASAQDPRHESRCDGVQNDPNYQDFVKFDRAIGEGTIAVFSEIKASPFGSESNLIELKVLLPSRWSSHLLEEIEACIDVFGEERGMGKTKVEGEGTGPYD